MQMMPGKASWYGCSEYCASDPPESGSTINKQNSVMISQRLEGLNHRNNFKHEKATDFFFFLAFEIEFCCVA